MNCVTQNKAPHKSNKKRLFISLMGGSFAVVAIAFLVMWKVAYPGLWEINEYLPMCFGLVLGAVAGLLALGNFSMLAGLACAKMLQPPDLCPDEYAVLCGGRCREAAGH